MLKLLFMRINYSYIIIITALVCRVPVFAQSADSASAAVQNLHIKKMKDYLSLKLSISDNVETFVVTTSDIKYDLRPNDKTVTKLSFNYRFVSFNISATPRFIPRNGDNNLKGKSKFINYSLNLNFNHWVQGLSYTRMKGYYLENTRDYRPGWREGTDAYIQFPHLVYQSFQGQTAYKFNKRFSFNALSVQTERQLKSAGTFMPSLSYRYYMVDDRTPLHANNQSQKTNNMELLLSASYFYTYVFKKQFYASAGLSPGAGIIFTNLYNRTQAQTFRSSYNNAIYKLEAGIGLGYNGERFFAGGQVQASDIIYSRKKVTNAIKNERAFYQLFIGYRFVAPKVLKNLLDKAEEKQSRLLRKK